MRLIIIATFGLAVTAMLVDAVAEFFMKTAEGDPLSTAPSPSEGGITELYRAEERRCAGRKSDYRGYYPRFCKGRRAYASFIDSACAGARAA